MRVLAMRWNTPPSGRDPVVGHQSWWGATSRRVRISGVRQRTLLGPLTVASTSVERWPTTPVLPQCPRGDPYFRSAVRTHGVLPFWWLGSTPSREGGPFRSSNTDESWVHTPRPLGVSKGAPPAWGSHFGVLGGGGVWENWVFVCVLCGLVLCRLSIVPSQNLRHRPAFEGQRVSLVCFPSGRGSPCLVGRAA